MTVGGASGASGTASSKPLLAPPALPALVESPAAEAALPPPTSTTAVGPGEAAEALAEAEGALAAATAGEEESKSSEPSGKCSFD